MVGDTSEFGERAGWRALPFAVPGIDEFQVMHRQVTIRFLIAGLLLALALAGAFVGADRYSLLLPMIALVAIALVIVLCVRPRTAFYITVAAACLFEIFQTTYSDALTDRVPYFWNINTIGQVYGGGDLKGFPFSLMEIVLTLAGASAFIRGVLTKDLKFDRGPLYFAFLGYLLFVAIAFVNGSVTGGDYKIALQESRGQFHFFLLYLLAHNQIVTVKQGEKVLWMVVLCVGLKGILYTYRRWVTLGGMEITDQGVGSHEEAFFFMAFVALLLTLGLCRVFPKLRLVMWLLLPTTYLGFVATNRRSGTASLVMGILVLLIAGYVCLPQRRRLTGTIIVLLATIGPVYYNVFKNSGGAIAAPARAIKSNYEPDWRDQMSNDYRLAEDGNQMATVKASPIIGWGYGKPFLHAVAIVSIANIYEWWDILPHNQILWVWQRTGTLGFMAFWILIASILRYHLQRAREPDVTDEEKAFHIFAAVVVGMELIVALYDMQLANSRNMIFTGTFAGFTFARKPALEAARAAGSRAKWSLTSASNSPAFHRSASPDRAGGWIAAHGKETPQP